MTLIGCSQKSETPFDCFIGKWKVDFGEETYYETWTKNSDGNYSGEAFMFSAGDTTNYETFRVEKQNTKWTMSVSFEDLEPVDFKIQESDHCKFKAVNPENDFPQIISYAYTDKGMSAFITNGEADTIHFNFIPLK